MNIINRFKTYQAEVQQSGIIAAFFNFFQGRATAFAIAFAVVGVILAFKGKLDANYSLFVTAIQGLVFAHSCKEDWHTQRMTALQQNNGQQNTTVDVNVQPAQAAPPTTT